MIDFSTLQGVIIPEGAVTQIESGGAVLWSAAKMLTVSIKKALYSSTDSSCASVTINGVVYDGGTETVVSVEAGTTIECFLVIGSTNGYLSVNGEKVITANGSYTYAYTVKKNCTITLGKMANPFVKDGRIQIAEE